MRQPDLLHRDSARTSSTTLQTLEGDPTQPDTSKPHRPGAAPPRPACISRDPAGRRQRGGRRSTDSPACSMSATEATPLPRSRTSRPLRILAAWVKRYFAHWRHASTDERGEAIVIVPPRDRRSRTQD